MTNLKTGIFALATVLGVGSGFTIIPTTPVKQARTTYYAVTTGNGNFSWTTVHPAHLSCSSGTAAYCTIVTDGSGYVPMDNAAPDPARFTTPESGNSRYR
jgi:hypothetical protein